MNLNSVIRRAIITEKSTSQINKGVYTFEVSRQANAKEVKRAVELAFGVKVKKIRSMKVVGKKRKSGRFKIETKKPDRQKVLVQLAEGQKIEAFELPVEEKEKKKK